MDISAFINYLKFLQQRMTQNETTARGAQLSYFFILSVFPFLIFLITLLDYTPFTQQNTLEQLSILLPQTAFAVIEQIATEIAAANTGGMLSFGIIGTLWAASRGTAALIKSINKAYGITECRSFINMSVVGVLATLGIALVILFTLSLLVFGKVIAALVFQRMGLEQYFYSLWSFIQYFLPLAATFTVFLFLYQHSPSLPLRVRDIVPGAVFSTLGWVGSSQLFAYYVNNFGNYSRTYGSIGGIIVFMVWLYISSVVILVGGEINASLYFHAIPSGPSKKLPM